jgi:hypothetical protein
MERCVDNTILWDNSLEEIFDQVCFYLTLCARKWIMFKEDKFCFGRKEVEYLGFLLTENSVKPSQEMLQSIAEFPQPKDLIVLLLSLVARESPETSDLQQQATLKMLTTLVTAMPASSLEGYLEVVVPGLVLCMQSKKAIVRKGVVEVFVASYGVVGAALEPFLADIHVVQRRLINIYIAKFKAAKGSSESPNGLRLVA